MPKLYERRVVYLGPGQNGRGEYVAQEWRICDCPDCAAPGHWMSLAIGGAKDEMERIAAQPTAWPGAGQDDAE